MISAILFLPTLPPWSETYSETTWMGSSSGWLGRSDPLAYLISLCDEEGLDAHQVSFISSMEGMSVDRFVTPEGIKLVLM